MYMNKIVGYTITLLELNDDARDFLEWFQTSAYVDEFAIEIKEDKNDNGEVIEILEIMQFNPFFNADALEEVYLIETGENGHVCENCAADHKKMMN
jgi:hypothetical protein